MTNRGILFLLAAACNTDGATSESSDTGGDTGTPTLPTYEPTWAGVQELFVDHCDRCHPAMQYIDLHEAVPYDVEAYQYLVKPGDPDHSVLWQVVSAPIASQLAMPYDTGLLPLAVVDPIRVWIENGASFE